MTMLAAFILAAMLLVVVVLGLVLPPLWRAPALPEATPDDDQRAINLAILRDQLAEIERERADGSLAEADFAQARNELQRRVLDEADLSPAAASQSGTSRKTAWALCVLLPLAAAAGYAVLGNPRALDPQQREARVTPAQIEKMLAQLEEKLKSNPQDQQGWLMLARSYRVLERHAEAAEAFGHAGDMVAQDATLLAEYAEVLAQMHGGSFAGRPTELIAQALRRDPDEPQVLLLAGLAASERQDYSAAAAHWARLLKLLEPGSHDAQTVEAALVKVRELAAQGQAGKAKAQAAQPAAR